MSLLFPAVDDMSWDAVDEARNVKGLRELRAVLGEIEEAAWSEAENDRQLDDAVREAY